jgi:hypothetical protein
MARTAVGVGQDRAGCSPLFSKCHWNELLLTHWGPWKDSQHCKHDTHNDIDGLVGKQEVTRSLNILWHANEYSEYRKSGPNLWPNSIISFTSGISVIANEWSTWDSHQDCPDHSIAHGTQDHLVSHEHSSHLNDQTNVLHSQSNFYMFARLELNSRTGKKDTGCGDEFLTSPTMTTSPVGLSALLNGMNDSWISSWM